MFLCFSFASASAPPNILLIVADDLGKIKVNTLFYILALKVDHFLVIEIIILTCINSGYNDVSWHNPDIISPNLEKLAKNGVILENHYVQPICTPTR